MQKKKHKPFVVSICSGKGGVGKSVVASNLAYCLSKEGIETLAWDADRNFPNLHLMLGVEPPVRLREVYAGKVRVDVAAFPVNDKMSLLADLPATGEAREEKPLEIADVFAQIQKRMKPEILIIDAPAGVSKDVVQCAAIADLAGVVINDEPTSLLDAYGLIKILLSYVSIEKIGLFVNNVIDMEDADEISDKLNQATEKFLGFRLNLTGFVPYSRMVRQSIMYQETLSENYPEDEASRAIASIAEKIAMKIREPQLR